jgi:hypothetical protein
MRIFKRSLITDVVLIATLFLSTAVGQKQALAAGADYDGNGFAEIPVLVAGSGGRLKWLLFDPISGTSSQFTPQLGRAGDGVIIANWLYPKVSSAGVVSKPSAQSKGRLTWTIKTNVVKRDRRGKKSVTQQQHVRYLGRRGEIIMTGGDFNGDAISDALVLVNRGTGHYKWGLRGNFFLASYNPGLNVNRAYFDFGILGVDKPFFVNPDGTSDWFAVLHKTSSGCDVVITQPFTKEVRTISVGEIPDDSIVPVPVAQDDGSDLLAFYGFRHEETAFVMKNIRGRDVGSFTVPFVGDVTVGNYGPGPGEEIAVVSQGRFFIFNPITGRSFEAVGPVGVAADSININTIQ